MKRQEKRYGTYIPGWAFICEYRMKFIKRPRNLIGNQLSQLKLVRHENIKQWLTLIKIMKGKTTQHLR